MKITLTNDKRMISDTARFVSIIAKNCGLQEERADALCFVIESTLEMRMRCNNENYPNIEIEIKDTFEELEISITDRGLPFVMTEGLSKTLALKCADRFRLEQLGTSGQKISFFFRIMGSGEKKVSKEPFELLDRKVICSKTGIEDTEIIEAIRCIYCVYGYEYLHPQIYHIDSFRSRMNSGRYVSVLARNEHGQTLGHCAIEELDALPGIMEVCNLSVLPQARGLGIANKLIEKTIRLGEETGVKGLFGRPALFHGASQKMLNQNAFTPCGVYFNVITAESTQDRSFGEDIERIHAAYCVHILDRKTEHILYLPEECRDFITDIFDREQMPYRVAGGDAPKTREAVFCYERDVANRRADIVIPSLGPDFIKSLEKEKEHFDLDAVDVFLVYLNMNDPSCPEAYEFLRSIGLIFSGCLPGGAGGDYILMQGLKGIPVRLETIVAEPGYDEMIEKICTMMDL